MIESIEVWHSICERLDDSLSQFWAQYYVCENFFCREIPNFIRTREGRNRYDTRSVYDHENKIMILSYCLKKSFEVSMRRKTIVTNTDPSSSPNVTTGQREASISLISKSKSTQYEKRQCCLSGCRLLQFLHYHAQFFLWPW